MTDNPKFAPITIARHFTDLSNVQYLAKGGQKWVYSAHHPSDGAVVLKVIKPDSEPERLRREILAVQKLQSARVPALFDAGAIPIEGETYVWVREARIDGINLRDVLNKGPLPIAEVVQLALEILEPLEAAEANKIVHRDVKPENIIRDSDGHFWLVDFGIARHLTLDSVTQTLQPFGLMTVGYAPPEQYRNIKSDIDSRSDLFALGVTLWEGVTGIHPFRAGARDAFEVFRRIEQVAYPPLDCSDLGLRDFISALVMKRPTHRPRTVAEALSWARELASPQQ